MWGRGAQSFVQLAHLCHVSRGTSPTSPSPSPSASNALQLAHIHHMNHGSDFKALDAKLRIEVTALRHRGYFGDGTWSGGKRLVGIEDEPADRPFDEDGEEHRWVWYVPLLLSSGAWEVEMLMFEADDQWWSVQETRIKAQGP